MMHFPALFVILFLNYVLKITGNMADDPAGKYFLDDKSETRIDRGKNSNIEEMGQFLMKASKSVPRIGRRNQRNEDLRENLGFDSELLPSPEMLAKYYQDLKDNPALNEWEYNKQELSPKFRYYLANKNKYNYGM